MAKSSFTRRDFLKASALGGSALALSHCTSLDHYFMGDMRSLQDEVVILGGGAAGLVAAFELKKRKIPFRLFEASSRVGGRVQSVPVFPEGGPVAELGAEFFETHHNHVFNVIRELSVSVKEVKSVSGLEAHLFSFSGKNYRVKDLVPKMKTLQAPMRRVRSDLFRDQDVILSYKNALQFERSAYYDSLSLRGLLEAWSSEVDPLILKLIEVQAVNRFGVDAADQSALHFLSTLDAEGSNLLSTASLHRVESGLSDLMQILAERVAGVIPDQIIRLNSPLTEISEKKGVFRLVFQTPKGKDVYQARRVICTLPFTALRNVKGIERMGFSQNKKDSIVELNYATHSKGVVGFTTPFWRTKKTLVEANLGNFTGDFLSQKIWDSSRVVNQEFGTPRPQEGLLTYQRAGLSGLHAGAGAANEMLKDLGLFYKDVPKPVTDQMINWSQRKWSQGSMIYYKPGQYMKYRGVAGESEYDGRFQFAGEHTSMRFPGTLQGSFESGIRAASEIT